MPFKDEYRGEILGVPGVFQNVHTWPVADGESSPLFSTQTFTTEVRQVGRGYEKGALIRAEVRFDDNCRNGHHSFAITAEIFKTIGGRKTDIAGGCLHDDIARVFPELAKLIPWHLCDTRGPMHYPANALYFAGDRDHNGKREGEPTRFKRAVRFGDNPIKHYMPNKFIEWLESDESDFDFEVISVAHKDRGGRTEFEPKFTLCGFAAEWHQCPFETEADALDFVAALQTCKPVFETVPVSWSKGKVRELDKARSSAIWPEATDAELCADRESLESVLMARLPDLLARFKRDILETGFLWSPSDA